MEGRVMKLFLRYLKFVLFVLFVPVTSVAEVQAEQETLIQSGGAAAQSNELLAKDKLKQETIKLKQEVVKLKLEIEQLRSPWGTIWSNPAFLTALGALLAVIVTAWKVIAENKRQKDLDRKQRIKELREREAENKRRADQKFTSIIEGLGSGNEAIQASACVSIATFLKPEYKSLHEQVFDILLANLRIQHGKVVSRLLVGAFEKALRIKLKGSKEKKEKKVEEGDERKYGLDLSRSDLVQVNLSNLDLSNADLGYTQLCLAELKKTILYRVRGYKANLKKAVLSGADLNEARMQHANFHNAYLHDCNLVAADLKYADFRGAQFFNSKMQSAHLEGADITGARFEQANLDDTYFFGVTVDEQALLSITRANNWRSAHFDDDVRSRLEEKE
jgi:uncharacterized protein YjbI with pentapeptide repeats